MSPVTDPREIKTIEVYEPATRPIHETGTIPEPTKKEIGFRQDDFELDDFQNRDLMELFKERDEETIKKFLVNWSYRSLIKARYALEKYTPGNLFELTGDEPPPHDDVMCSGNPHNNHCRNRDTSLPYVSESYDLDISSPRRISRVSRR